MSRRFDYNWTLKDANFTKDKGKVFSCFACGGGSTMGYKLAGFDVIGCNEIDNRMMLIYKANHNPRYTFLEPIQEFKQRESYPDELYNLDILDGSPPCSAFSMAGSREGAWGVEKKFREGQAKQVLDTLFFDFIEVAQRLQPKVVIAENVKGLLLGEAKKYVQRIYAEFDRAGYVCQHFLLDAQRMGVPQRRERVFFICLRKDLVEQVPTTHTLFDVLPLLKLDFEESPILFGEVADYNGREILAPKTRLLWDNHIETDRLLSDVAIRLFNKKTHYNFVFFDENEVAPTLTTAGHDNLILKSKPLYLSRNEILRLSSFPIDFDATDRQIGYLAGMSVPPVMMAQIATEVYEQWLVPLRHHHDNQVCGSERD